MAMIRRLGPLAIGTAVLGLGLLPRSSPGADAQAADTETSGIEAIIVTARKRAESVETVPESITVFTGENLAQYNIQTFNDYATKTPNISFSYGGGPTGISDARTVAIRGITGQNLYGTSGATGFYIDDTPVPGSVDPRVLDIDNIEVLKGPQGTLFGESSLGGNVRLITKKPDLLENGIGYMVQAGATSGAGSPDGGANVIGNLVLIPSVLAARIVAFGNHDGGYLTRTFPDPTSPAAVDPFLSAPRTSVGDQGAQTSYGGSVAILFKPSDLFDARLRVMYQNSWDHGFPAAYAPLPAFKPEYILNRAVDAQPMAWDKWALPSLDVAVHGEGWSLISSTSYFYRHTRDLEDSTYGTQQIFASYYQVSGLPPQPYLWDGEHYHNQVTEEVRLSWDPWHNLSGTAGAFYSHTDTKFTIPPTYANGLVAATVNNAVVGPWPNDEIWTQTNPARQEDKSLFGELYYKIFDPLSATVGVRKYWLNQRADFTADGFMNFGPTPSDPQTNRQTGFDPKYSLAYQFTPDAMAYATASKGFRAGGAQAALAFCALPNLPENDITQLKSDTLWTYEVGGKVQLPHPGLLLSVAGFHIDWRNLQQQLALPCGAYFDINGGRATINGGEIELSGRLLPGLQVRLGAGYEDTKITEPGALAIFLSPDSRILGTPAWTANAGAVYTTQLTNTLDGFLSADYSFTGNSVSLLNGGGGSEATRPSYSLVNARFGVSIAKSEVSINLHNITNAKPNLGDIGYLGYAQYDSAGSIIPQAATLQPFTILLQYRKSL